MKLYKPFLLLSFFFNYSSAAWAIPLDNLQQSEEFFIESSELNLPSDTLQTQDENTITPDDKQISGGDVSEFYLFEQEELDAQKPGLEIYETLAPMLSPEMKKDAKRVWANTADFRDAINFSSKDSDSKELILQQSSKKMSLSKWNTVKGASDNNLPAVANDRKAPDQVVVRELFDGIFDLIKNAFFIIAGILIVGKIVSLIVIKIMSQRKKRKRKHSRRRRKRHRRTLSASNSAEL